MFYLCSYIFVKIITFILAGALEVQRKSNAIRQTTCKIFFCVLVVFVPWHSGSEQQKKKGKRRPLGSS